MGFYEDMQGIATGVLSDFKQGKVEYQPIARTGGTVDEPGAITVAAKVLLKAAARGVKFKYVSMGLAVASDLQVTSAVISGGFDMRGMIFVDDVQYKIVQIIPKPAAGTPAAFTLIIRK